MLCMPLPCCADADGVFLMVVVVVVVVVSMVCLSVLVAFDAFEHMLIKKHAVSAHATLC